jgi:hypothetical protein
VIAIACGSTVLTHRFWLVGRFLDMDEMFT